MHAWSCFMLVFIMIFNIFSGVYPICIPFEDKREKVEEKNGNINFSSLKTVLKDNNKGIKLTRMPTGPIFTTYAPH